MAQEFQTSKGANLRKYAYFLMGVGIGYVIVPAFFRAVYFNFYAPIGIAIIMAGVGTHIIGGSEDRIVQNERLIFDQPSRNQQPQAQPAPLDRSADSPTNLTAPSDVERDRFLFDLINQRQTQEFQRSDDIDSKANNLLVFDTAIIGFILAAASVLKKAITSQPLLDVWIFIFGLSALVVAVFFVFVAQRVRKWGIVPDVIQLVDKYSASPLQGVIEIVGGEMAKNVHDLETHINSKALILQIGWYLTLAGLGVILIYTVTTLIF